MKRLFAAVFVLSLAVGISSLGHAQGGPAAGLKKKAATMKIVSFTGQVQIKMADGSVIGVVPGAPVPEIPAGAEIVIVSGEAVFEAGGTVVSGAAGDSFSFNTTSGGIDIAGTGTGSVQVTVGKTEATVKSGSSVEIKGTGQGKGEMKVASGSVEVSQDGGASQSVAKGGSVVVVAPPELQAVSPPVAPPPTMKPVVPPVVPPVVAPVVEPPPTFDAPPPPNPAQEEQASTEVSPSSP